MLHSASVHNNSAALHMPAFRTTHKMLTFFIRQKYLSQYSDKVLSGFDFGQVRI
jgi:hypothetical protein